MSRILIIEDNQTRGGMRRIPMKWTIINTSALGLLLSVLVACSGDDQPSCEDCGGQPDYCPDKDMACCLAYANNHPMLGNSWRGEIQGAPIEMYKGVAPDPCDEAITVGLDAKITFDPYPINNSDNTSVHYSSYTQLVCVTTNSSPADFHLPRIQGIYEIVEDDNSLTIQGLDFFPFLDDEEYRVDLSESICTEGGGDSFALELIQPDYPISLFFNKD